MIHNHDPAQHGLGNIAVFIRNGNQLVSHSEHAFFFQGLRVFKLLRMGDAGKGQKGCASCFCLL